MIRDILESDRQRVIDLYTEVYQATPEEIETLQEAQTVLVFERESVLGFAHYNLWDDNCYLELGVDSKEDIEAIGKALWEELKVLLISKKIQNVVTFHVQEEPRWKALMDAIGFDYGYSVYRLVHEGDAPELGNLKVVPYTDAFFEQKSTLESDAFESVRRENGITPHNWYAASSEEAKQYVRNACEKNASFIHLYYDGDEMVGASQVKEAEVEVLFTVTTHQGKGYGREILRDVISKGKTQGDGRVFLNVIAQNEKAIQLYLSEAFVKVQAQDCRKLTL